MITDLILQAVVSNIYSKQIQRFFRELQFNIFSQVATILLAQTASIQFQLHLFQVPYQQELKYPKT